MPKKPANRRRAPKCEAAPDTAPAEGESPVEYMLRVMRDPKATPSRRDTMAKSATPYIHPRPAPKKKRASSDASLKKRLEFLGDSATLREAERLLREQEDRVFRLVQGEDADLGTHVRADIPRFEALNARTRLGQARQDRKADTHLLMTAIGFVVILAKLFGGFDLVLKAMSVL